MRNKKNKLDICKCEVKKEYKLDEPIYIPSRFKEYESMCLNCNNLISKRSQVQDYTWSYRSYDPMLKYQQKDYV